MTQDAEAAGPDMQAVIREILEGQEAAIIGLTISDLHRLLGERTLPVGRAQVEQAVREMVAAGALEERTGGRSRRYHLPGHGVAQMALFDGLLTRDEIEQEVRDTSDLWGDDEEARTRTTTSVLQAIATGHALEENFAQAVRDIAPALAAEHPVDLILRALAWATADLNRLADRLQAAATGRADETRRLSGDLEFRRHKVIRFFQRLCRLDAPAAGLPGMLSVPSVKQMQAGQRMSFDAARAEARLRERIMGDRVIDLVRVPDNMHRAAIGSDASVGDVQVRHERGSFMPPTPAVLFVAAAAMRVRDPSAPYWDYDLDPRDLERYEDLAAAEEGFLISPRLRREVKDFRHLRSAAMELRQYAEELRVVQQRARWYPIGGVPELQSPPVTTLLFRDGRIFPLVHRLDDYDGASAPDDVLYGSVVRREINAFRDVFHGTAGLGRTGAVYGGAVKAPEFSWLAMLVFWYLHTAGNRADLAEGFYSPPLNDQAVMHLLCWGLTEAQRPLVLADPRNMLMSFRVVRRFSDIAFEAHPLVIEGQGGRPSTLVNEDSEDDWFTYIERHLQDATHRHELKRRRVEPLQSADEYRAFLDLCRRAGVAMFYGAPAQMYRATVQDRNHFLTPRWELALDLTTFTPATMQFQLERMLAWLVDPGGLVRDESHAVGGFDEAEPGLPLFIPDVVQQAHEVVGATRDRHVPDVQDRLHQLVQAIRAGTLTAVQP